MSFLDNVLTSIGGKATEPSAPKPRPQTSNSTSTTVQVQKRKAEDLHKDQNAKRERIEPTTSSNGSAAEKPDAPPAYRGTAGRVTVQQPSKPSAKQVISNTVIKSTSKPAPDSPKAPAAPSAPTPAPRGFLAVLARGQKASQTVASQSFGAIKHKPAETRKERLAKEREEVIAAAKAKAAAGRGKPGPNGASKTTHMGNKTIDRPGEKPKREPAALGYKGTARGSEPVYKGTALLSKSSASKYDRSRSNSAAASARRADKNRPSGYASYSSAEDLDEEKSDGYGSDRSSDMEAGFDDMEYEERAALRAAIQDDEKELALERKLKTEKDRRKDALARLSAERAKKRY